MGGVLSSIVETFIGNTDYRPPPQNINENFGYSRQQYDYRPTTFTNNTSVRRQEQSSESYSRKVGSESYASIVGSNSSQCIRPSEQVRPSYSATPQRASNSMNHENQFYNYIMNQCLIECKWISFTGEVKLIPLTQNTTEYDTIGNEFLKYLKRERPNIIKIKKVQNNILMGQYLLKKAEYQYKRITSFQERQYYHGTKEKNISGILRNNFDWRITKRNLFGKGVSFTPKSSYAINYCDRNPNKIKVMFVARVLTGKTCEGSKDLPLPYKGFDATGKTGGDVIVKYYDNEFYPEYVIYFKANIIQRQNIY